MSVEVYLAYIVAATVISIVPGPTVLLVVTQALAHGRRAAAPSVAGVVAGDCAALALSIAGLGALLAASAAWFTAVKWVGAAYLIYLGVGLWMRSPGVGRRDGYGDGDGDANGNGDGYAVGDGHRDGDADGNAHRHRHANGNRHPSPATLFAHVFVVTTFNPKSIVFFIAFLPQFVDTAAAVVPQLALLGATFVVIGGVNAYLYGRFAATFRRRGDHRHLRRAAAAALISAGAFTAAAQRA